MNKLIVFLIPIFLFAKSVDLDFSYCENGSNNDCQKILDLLKDTCKDDGAKACGSLGFIYERGLSVKKDIRKAMFFYHKACNLNYNLGCVNLGVIHANNKRFQEANKLFETSCDNDNAEGCMNLGVSYNYGYGFIANPQQADKFFKEALNLYLKSCNKSNANDCFNVAIMHYGGFGTPRDIQIGDEFLQKACDIDESFCE